MSKSVLINTLKTMLVPLKRIIDKKAEAPNWNENNPASTSYIKNRPFYSEEQFKTLVDNKTVNITDDYIQIIHQGEPLISGKTYIVDFNGQTYRCIARYYENENCVLIGNGQIYGDGNIGNNEPFSCDSYSEGDCYLNVQTNGKYTISIFYEKEIVHKIDKKYIPDLDLKLADVATSGDYWDLDNIPQPDWNAKYGEAGHILNRICYDYPDKNLISSGTITTNTYNNGIYYSKQYLHSSINTQVQYLYIENLNIILERKLIGYTLDAYGDPTLYHYGYGNLSLLTQDLFNSVAGTTSTVMVDDTFADTGENFLICAIDGILSNILYYVASKTSGLKITNLYEYFINTKTINDKYIPSSISRVKDTVLAPATATIGQIIAVKSVDGNNRPIEWEAINKIAIDNTLTIEGDAADAKTTGDTIFSPKNNIVFIDQSNGYNYIACMRNGNFVTYCAIKNLEITAMPAQTEYTAGEYFIPDGMVISAVTFDGTIKEITGWTYDTSPLDETKPLIVTYIEANIKHTIEIPITINAFDPAAELVDFFYTDNGNGTYTLTGWKQTLNGVSSTEMIVPNNTKIIL